MSPEAISSVLKSQEWMALSIAFVAVVISPFVQWHISNKQIRATIRSSNRQNWIDDFRDELSKYIALSGKYAHAKSRGLRVDLPEVGHFERREIFERMRLRLNPNEMKHCEFEKALSVLHEASNLQELTIARADVVNKAREMFKYEWERVKRGK